MSGLSLHPCAESAFCLLCYRSGGVTLAPFIPCVVRPCHRILFFFNYLLVPVLPPRPCFPGLRVIFILGFPGCPETKSQLQKPSCGLKPPLAHPFFFLFVHVTCDFLCLHNSLQTQQQ